MLKVADVYRLLGRFKLAKRTALIGAVVLLVACSGLVYALTKGNGPIAGQKTTKTHKEYVTQKYHRSWSASSSQYGSVAGDSTTASDKDGQSPNAPPRKTPTEKAVDKVARDLRTHRLTQEQADLLTAKLKEIDTYAASIENETQADWTKLMAEKTPEWRQWSRGNDISYRYIDNYVEKL